MFTVASCASETLSPLGYFFSSISARTVRPVSVVVAAMSSTTVRKLRRGLPRQLMLMKEKSRCSILFHLLVPGGKWHTVIGNLSSSASFCSSDFPQTDAIAVRSTAVSGHQQTFGFRITFLSHGLPPAANGVDRTGGGVVIRSDADPTGVVVDVINAVWHRAFQLGINEVMHIDLFGSTFGSPFAARILEIAHQFLLFRIDRDDRLAVRQEAASLFADVFKLSIPVQMLASFVDFPIGL